LQQCEDASFNVCFSDLDIDIEDNGDGTFSIYYTVKDAGEYTLSVKFGGQPVPDGFYTFTVSRDLQFLFLFSVLRSSAVKLLRNASYKLFASLMYII
jgi:hypothetical protein